MKTFNSPSKAVQAAGGGNLDDLLAEGRVIEEGGSYRVPEPGDWMVFDRGTREITEGPFSTKKQALRSLNIGSTERRIEAGLYIAEGDVIVGRREVAKAHGFKAWPDGETASPQNVGKAIQQVIEENKDITGLDEQEALNLNNQINQEPGVFTKVAPDGDGTFRITTPNLGFPDPTRRE